jgi:hypothetical protein
LDFLSPSAEGDKAFVLEMLARFSPVNATTEKDNKNKSFRTESSVKKQIDPVAMTKDLSVGEFIRQFEIKKHTDFVLAFGYYLEKHTDKDNFTPADINDAYYDAKLEPSNTSQMIIQNIRRSFLMEAKTPKDSKSSRKHYTLTQAGEKHIAKLLGTKSTS